MTYIDVGAYVNGRRPATKKALREALLDHPADVYFDVTALMGPRAGDYIQADPDDIGSALLIVAGPDPDPYAKRNWYATVAVAGLGEHTHLTVK